MDAKKLFDKYYSRLAREGMIKALFCGLTIAFVATTIVAGIFWYSAAKGGLLCSILTLVVVAGATVPLFYFKKFKPDAKQVAMRLDRIGLKERMITMTEFQGDESFLAQKQREDAHISLHALDTKRIRFKFSKMMIVAVAVAFALGTTSTTFAGLVETGVIKPGKEVIDNVLPIDPADYININYVIAEGEGLIEGDDLQIVEIGENCTEIIAVADDGYQFVEWSDGSKDPVRLDTGLTEDTTFEAIFAPIGEGEGDGEGEGEGEGEPGAGKKPGRNPEPTKEDGEPQGGANGSYEENNLILDGTQKYLEYLMDYEKGSDITRYEEILAWLETADNLPPDLREFIQTYFDILV